MKKITLSIALIAVIGAAAFVLQANDRMIPWSTSVFDAPADSLAVVERDVAGERASREAATDASVAVEPTADDLYMADAVASFYTPQATPGARSAAAATTDERPARSAQAAAMAKMSSQVAALAASGGNAPVELIVSYDDYPQLFEDGRIESLGGEVVRRYSIIEQLAVRLPADALIDLAVDDSVDRVSLDETVRVTAATLLSSSAPELQSSALASNRPVYPSPNRSFNGRYINVAMIDTGVASHVDLTGRVQQFSFLDGESPDVEIDGELSGVEYNSLRDGYGHGTHVAGILSATGKSSGGKYTAMATGANILSLQVLDDNGLGQTSDVIAALDWLLQYGQYFDIDVVNMSLGKPVTESNTTDPLVLAVEALWDSGMVVVVAAGNQGNDGYFTVTSPGNSRKVITVGSLTDNGTGTDFSDDYVSTFSSRGPTPGDFVVKPDLVAPGNRLVSTIPSSSTLGDLLPDRMVACSMGDECDDYFMLSGTSMAAPMVSATAALMLQKDPSLTPATVKARLMRSARKYGHSPIDAGAGLLDVDAALNEANTVSGEALSPLMQQDPATGATLIQETGVLWGDTIWGSGYLWTDGGGINSNGYLWTDGGGINANGYLWTDGGGIDANGYLWTDGTVDANGYLWTDGGLVANGYLWTDGGTGGGRIAANGFLWTDGGGIGSDGYLWTDGGGTNVATFFDPTAENPELLDDEHTVQ
ncbi:MAG: S8 family peptidase [Woeseiaceae bacterium]|nr:S8 family peptidase [Woeseiaceae bacterium]